MEQKGASPDTTSSDVLIFDFLSLKGSEGKNPLIYDLPGLQNFVTSRMWTKMTSVQIPVENIN